MSMSTPLDYSLFCTQSAVFLFVIFGTSEDQFTSAFMVFVDAFSSSLPYCQTN